MLVTAKRSFLVKQDELEGGKKKDVKAIKGQKINLTEKEAIKFWGALDLTEADKKKLMPIARSNGYKRLV
jgi:hypothetical protein